MKISRLAYALVFVSAPVFAEDAAPAGGGMDMSKMGPWTRKPTNEKQTKKEIAEFFKQEDELAKKGDFDGAIARIDFPVYMFTDDAKGVPEASAWDKDKYVGMMKPFWENMPKDMKVTHKPTVMVLSDSLVNVTDEYTTTMGKMKLAGRSSGVLVKVGGAWKWKVMGEAGWGGEPPAPAPAPMAKVDAKLEAKTGAKVETKAGAKVEAQPAATTVKPEAKK